MNIKTLINYFETFTNNHPILRTFSWGNLSDYSRDTFITEYPAIHIVPQPSTIDTTSTNMSFSVLIYDLLNEYVGNPINSNQLDSMALTQEILNDFINEFINQLTDYGYYLQMPVQFTPFVDRFAESVCGVEAIITITMEQTACIPPYIVPSPTPSPTATITPTPTATITPTPTCPITTQYLEVELSENTKFKLILWNDAGFTSAANALCDYTISGTAYGDMGTIYTGVETILEGQHQHQFNLSPVLQPGEIVVGFNVWSYTATTCVCPVNLILPVSPTPTPTPTTTTTPTPTPTPASYPVIFVSSGETFEDICSNPQFTIPTLYSPQPFFTDGQQLYYNSALTQFIDWSIDDNSFFASTGGTQLYFYGYAGNGLTTYGFTCPSPTPTPTPTPTS